jgi:hypothetical protein
MNRNQAKEMLPIIQAHAEGKTIQSRYIKGDTSLWYDNEDPSFDDDFEYRVKPESKYRPFKDAEECWQEMQNHQPFGFMKFKDTESGYYMLTSIARGVGVGINDSLFSYDRVFDDYTFADGTPFGIKVEE